MNPLESLLGGPGTPVRCREIADGAASVHFWAAGAEPGDMCLCGTRPYRVSLPTKDTDDAG